MGGTLPSRILVIDDDPFVRSVVQAALEGAGATLKICASGDEAITAVVAFRPSLVLLDFVMSGMDGRITWHALRARLNGASIALPAVIFLTAKRDMADEAAALGAIGVLAKPFNPATLVDELCRMLGNAPAGRTAPVNRLEGVSAEFQRSLPSTADAIESLWSDIRGRGWHHEAAEALRAKAHSLAGSAGLFGRHALGSVAEDAERLLLNALKLAHAPDGYELQKIGAVVAALITSCRQ